jgi:hypothetical protein
MGNGYSTVVPMYGLPGGNGLNFKQKDDSLANQPALAAPQNNVYKEFNVRWIVISYIT